jgi:hypothetical protein
VRSILTNRAGEDDCLTAFTTRRKAIEMKRNIQIIVYWGVAFVLGSLWITFVRGIDFGIGALFGGLFGALLAALPIGAAIWGHKNFFPSSQKNTQENSSVETNQTPNNANDARENKQLSLNAISRHPLVIVVAAGLVVLALYFILSPYQRCISNERHSERYCMRNTSW